MASSEDIIRENLAAVRFEIAEAAQRSGRSIDDVHLIAITKYVGAAEVNLLVRQGCRRFGESRPQAFWQKRDSFQDHQLEWHFIGHLQTNKVKRTVADLALLESGDRMRLLEAVNEARRELGQSLDILLEVNISGDTAKHGFAPNDLARNLPQIANLDFIRVRGLMGMASFDGGRERARRDFEALRVLRDSLLGQAPDSIVLEHLSMGMSRDFDIAIEEGATMVRVGSRLFTGIAQ